MVIDDFNIGRPRRSLWPLEADPPLVVDANAVLAFPVAFERFETVAGQVQIQQRRGRIMLVELHLRLALKTNKDLDPVSFGKLAVSLSRKLTIIVTF